MAKNGKMQQMVMRVLVVMMAASFLLAAVSFVWPAPVSAEYWTECPTWHCCSDCYCEPGHMVCHDFYWLIHQGGGDHCTNDKCHTQCEYDTWVCPE